MDIISSRKNPLIVHLKKISNSRAYRRQCGEFICDGYKLLSDALKSDIEIIIVLYSKQLPELPQSIRTVKVTEDIINLLSSFKSPQDIIFVCRIPKQKAFIDKGKHLVLENMQDPGNVGAIVRTANAFGMDSVILTGESADPFSPKSVRGSMGAIFRQRIFETDCKRLLEMLSASEIPLYASALEEDSIDLSETSLPENLALAIGNEGRGLSRELLLASRQKLMIPMKQGTQSLNAAAAATVFMWELFK